MAACATDITNTELAFSFHLRSAGLQPGGAPDDVRVLVPAPALTAGTHTLAVSMHNNTAVSSDMGLSLEFSALNPATTTIYAVVSNVVRDFKGTPLITEDDEFSYQVTLSGSNTGATWTSDGPVASGRYGTATTLGPFPASGPSSIAFSTAANPLIQTTVLVDPPAPSPRW